MNVTYPNEIQKENDELITKYMSLPDGTDDVDTFIRKNASKEFIEYMKNKIEDDKALHDKGIIVN